MKKTILLLLLSVFSIGISNAENLVSVQKSDTIIYQGTAYSLNSYLLKPFFEKHPEKKLYGDVFTTDLFRGYVAQFEIIQNQLFVTDIKIKFSDKESIDNYPYKWVSVYDQIFPNTTKTKIDWHSGILILPNGEMDNYIRMGEAQTYSDYLLLEIENGNFKETRRYSKKEFNRFKKRQFKKFEKTNKYEELFINLKSNDDFGDDKFIKSYISDSVMEFTSKFLVE
ncbi:MAG: hypothetical protein PSN34_15815 [Urechidicola sp.]|nr:hypothetical protein [Urechidicola sp.]